MEGAASSLSPRPRADNTSSSGFFGVDLCRVRPSILTGAHNLSFGPQSICVGWGCVPRFPDEESETQGYGQLQGALR